MAQDGQASGPLCLDFEKCGLVDVESTACIHTFGTTMSSHRSACSMSQMCRVIHGCACMDVVCVLYACVVSCAGLGHLVLASIGGMCAAGRNNNTILE